MKLVICCLRWSISPGKLGSSRCSRWIEPTGNSAAGSTKSGVWPRKGESMYPPQDSRSLIACGMRGRLGIQPGDLPRKRYSLADVGNPTDPGHSALDAQTEPRVDKGAVLSEIEIPAVGLGIETLTLDPAQQLVVVILPLGPADDLAISLRCQAVVVQYCPGIVRVFLHVEGLHVLGIV